MGQNVTVCGKVSQVGNKRNATEDDMLLELHTTATNYFRYLRLDGTAWTDVTARRYRARIVEQANAAGVTGAAFQRFVTRVAVQAVTA